MAVRQSVLSDIDKNMAAASVTMNFVSRARMQHLIRDFAANTDPAISSFAQFLVNRRALSFREANLLKKYPELVVMRCPACPLEFDITGIEPGKQFECPKCFSVITVPFPSTDLSALDDIPIVVRDDDAYQSNATPQHAESDMSSIYEELEKQGIHIVRQVGRGGMGVVFYAEDQNLKRKLAIKLMLAGTFASDSQKARFEREASLVASIKHPNIVAVHSFGNVHGQRFFSMDYIDGKPLDKVIADGELKPRDTALIVSTICRAVQAAHNAGVIHRDLKPANVLFDSSGKPYITDFGLAKNADATKSLTESGMAIGTPHYMSPEQASGDQNKIEARSDVYSIGVMLYEMLCGRVPFDGERAVEVLMKVINDEAEPPSTFKQGIPRDLEAICMKAMSRNPADRYVSAEAMAEDLDAYSSGGSIIARPPTPAERMVKRFWRYRFAIALIGLGCISLVLALYTFGSINAVTQEEADAIKSLDAAIEALPTGEYDKVENALEGARRLADNPKVAERAEGLSTALLAHLYAKYSETVKIEDKVPLISRMYKRFPAEKSTQDRISDFTGLLKSQIDQLYETKSPATAASQLSAIATALEENALIIEPIRIYMGGRLEKDAEKWEKMDNRIDDAVECLQALVSLFPLNESYPERLEKLKLRQQNVLMEFIERALTFLGFGRVVVTGDHYGCSLELEALSGSIKGNKQTFDLRVDRVFTLQNGLYLLSFSRNGFRTIERRIAVVADQELVVEVKANEWIPEK